MAMATTFHSGGSMGIRTAQWAVTPTMTEFLDYFKSAVATTAPLAQWSNSTVSSDSTVIKVYFKYKICLLFATKMTFYKHAVFP